ncbi:hypothetical protein HK099_007005 [Clydaea vesicula]|uniref:Reverse transcriptase domain-containing protein n=1 Tax=Clydaea vesicula TaxID=447962 RepID=A0AAD5XYR4_9FUNG|nr:hypothetical protein HK099_007005 [Clydaea vesicula]
MAAYDKVRINPNTKGTNNTTLDGINKDWFEKTTSDIRTGRFSFKLARRLDIPKPKEAIFEPTFHPASHGFRPKRSCHSALNDIKMKFGSSHWFIEGDISKCFDTINHKRAGYINFDKVFHNTEVGAPQGSVISPIISNIVLNELDKWIEEYTISFNKGERRRANPEYTKLIRGKVSKFEQGERKLVSLKPRPQLLAPISHLCNKLVENKYAKISKGSVVPTRNGKLIHLNEHMIIQHFTAILRGIINYYTFTSNFTRFKARMYYILKYSCALTLCTKMKLGTLRKTFKKYGPDLTVEIKDKKKISFPKYDEFKSKNILKLSYNYDPVSIIDLFSKKTYRTESMTNAVCSICGSKERVEMHHINKISNISPSSKGNYTKSLMIRLNRRQIPVCNPCHNS